MNPEKVERWSLVIYNAMHGLGRVFGFATLWVDRQRIGSRIEVSVNEAMQRLNLAAPDAAPHLLRVEWATYESAMAYLVDDVVIVKVDPSDPPEKSIATATLAYLSRGLLPQARGYVDKSLRRAMDLIVTQTTLATDREIGGSQYFLESILQRELENDSEVSGMHATLDQLDRVGYFARIYLTELCQLGDRLQPRAPSHGIEVEIRSFVRFLYTLENGGAKIDHSAAV